MDARISLAGLRLCEAGSIKGTLYELRRIPFCNTWGSDAAPFFVFLSVGGLHNEEFVLHAFAGETPVSCKESAGWRGYVPGSLTGFCSAGCCKCCVPLPPRCFCCCGQGAQGWQACGRAVAASVAKREFFHCADRARPIHREGWWSDVLTKTFSVTSSLPTPNSHTTLALLSHCSPQTKRRRWRGAKKKSCSLCLRCPSQSRRRRQRRRPPQAARRLGLGRRSGRHPRA